MAFWEDPQNEKKWKKTFILEIVRNLSHGHFKPLTLLYTGFFDYRITLPYCCPLPALRFVKTVIGVKN